MELPSGAVEICPVNLPSPLAALRAEQGDCAEVGRGIAANKSTNSHGVARGTGTFLKMLSFVEW
jgi:hypothetical protein